MFFERFQKQLGWACLAAVLLCGCTSTQNRQTSEEPPQKTIVLQRVSAERAKAVLSDLGLGVVSAAIDANSLALGGPPAELAKAAIVLNLVDTDEGYVVQKLAPASMARTLPSNDRIAQIIGGLAIGTFSAPPQSGARARGIIDIQGENLVAIVPAHLWPDIRAVVEFGAGAERFRKSEGNPHARPGDSDDLKPDDPPSAPAAGPQGLAHALPEAHQEHPTKERTSDVLVSQLTEFGDTPADTSGHDAVASQSDVQDEAESSQKTSPAAAAGVELKPAPSAQDNMYRGVLKPAMRAKEPVASHQGPTTISLPDGDDVIELSLPEKINLAQLIDLVGEYLHLDCMYDTEKIGNQIITLRLHSKLKSETTVRDLYSLLETILKFRGLVMTRQEGNLVTIVPATEALDVNPELVDPNSKALQAGDMVVTRVFQLRHVGVASVVNLLQNMKLSVATSAIEETQTLFVTCYAHRMARIEQLVDMVDQPGSPREFRFRQLKHTVALSIAQKVLALAAELQDISITIAAAEDASGADRSSRRTKNAAETTSTPGTSERAIYLDTDDRTNRILMIGYEEQLEMVEGLIDVLDIPQQDQPILKQYKIRHVGAAEVVEKLNVLDVAAAAYQAGRSPRGSKTPTPETSDERPQVVLLEATNSLLVNATCEQHDQIATIIGYVDVLPQDSRTLKAYDIQHADAEDVVRKLQDLGFIGQATSPTRRPAKIVPADQAAPSPAAGATEGALAPDLQFVVLEATNSLLVYATDEQHNRLQAIIPYIDVEARRERIPYEIYFLENQDPEHMAEVLGRLVQETITDKEGKVEQIIKKTEDEVTIIPDTGTFSLIVYASRKNQEWVADLVKQLDKRRPQVLIDVTLVEIAKTESFTYDLNLIQSFPDLTATSGLTGTISGSVTSSDIMDKLAASGRSQFADYQSNAGDFTGFYGDKHINLLLQAMQSKNYGRVLAKPKILVNDNQPGTIKTTDTTYVTKRSSIPVSSGGAGNDATLIETAVDYQSYEAGITLNITPHISQGELLRLDIELIRSDFRETEDDEKPPDTTASELTTTVFVPDGSTIILGGLLKMNQNKGGAKVPILGDIPLIGGLFRSINNKDMQNKLYVFVKAEIIRPDGVLAQGMGGLDAISEKNRAAFEEHEKEFQTYQNWPGIKPKPVEPPRVLEAR